jgi:hypothetical protein
MLSAVVEADAVIALEPDMRAVYSLPELLEAPMRVGVFSEAVPTS